jgi:hypothetical protein
VRAKSRSRLVYTEQGPLARREDPLPADLSGVDGDACQHGGFLVGTVLVCGECGDEGEQLWHAVQWLARKISLWSAPQPNRWRRASQNPSEI